MKKVTTIGFIISVVVFISALYLQFIVIPQVTMLDIGNENYSAELESSSADDSLQSLKSTIYYQAHSFADNFIGIVLWTSIISFLLCIFSAIKSKSKISFVGILFSAISVFISLIATSQL